MNEKIVYVQHNINFIVPDHNCDKRNITCLTCRKIPSDYFDFLKKKVEEIYSVFVKYKIKAFL